MNENLIHIQLLEANHNSELQQIIYLFKKTKMFKII